MRKASEARFYALTTATACALALIAGVVGAPVRAVIQDLVFDQYQRWQPRPYAFDQPVRIVDVDEESLKRIGQWPWSRDRLAALVEALKGAGAAAIAFDVLFSEKDRADAGAPAGETPDDVFARAIDGAPVVLGSFVSDAPNGAARSRQGGFRHRRRRRDQVFDARARRACASVRVGATRRGRRLPQLAAGLRPGRAAGAAHPQCRWGAAAKFRDGGASRRAGRVDLYRQVLERQRRNGVRRSLRRAGGPQWRPDDRHGRSRRDQAIFRAPRSAPLDPGVESPDAGGGSQRPSRRDRILRRERGDAVGHRRHAVVAPDARRRSPCANPRADPERRHAEAAGLGPERRVDGDGLALRGAGGDDLGFGPAVRGARIRRRGLRDRRGQLVCIFAPRASHRSDLSRVLGRRWSISPASRRFMR